MAYKSIHTSVGLALMSAAEVSGTPITLTEMAVGDALGNSITEADITEGMTSLIREVYRATINRVYQDPDDPLLRYAEMVIPATEGGFVMREVGVFTADGDLYVVGNLPETWKPEDTEGAFSDTVIKVAFKVSNADIVVLTADPSAVTVTQGWIENNVDACYILPGGTTGQILKKASNTCGDVEWADADAIEVLVDAIEEKQTLAALQTTVSWATVTTVGLAVYIEGVRIPRGAGAGEWLPAAAPDELTDIVLGQAYPDGTKIVGVQNDPAGNVGDPLQAFNNLSDVDDVPTARTNLDVYSKAETDQKAPPGLVAAFARSTAPTGWLKANGAAVSRTTYADLFAAIGTTFGVGDGFTTFNLPDCRAEFIRGLDDSRGVDLGRTLGSAQSHAFQTHGHKMQYRSGTAASGGASQASSRAAAGSGAGTSGITTQPQQDWAGEAINVAGTAYTAPNADTETRPRNIALLYCIKF